MVEISHSLDLLDFANRSPKKNFGHHGWSCIVFSPAIFWSQRGQEGTQPQIATNDKVRHSRMLLAVSNQDWYQISSSVCTLPLCVESLLCPLACKRCFGATQLCHLGAQRWWLGAKKMLFKSLLTHELTCLHHFTSTSYFTLYIETGARTNLPKSS